MAPFDGETYSHRHDAQRLTTLLAKVLFLMADGKWRTLGEIRDSVKLGTEAGISARLRDFRKEKFGGLQVDRRRRGDPKLGTFEYRVISPAASAEPKQAQLGF